MLQTIENKMKQFIQYVIYVSGVSAILVGFLILAVIGLLLIEGTSLSAIRLDMSEVVTYFCWTAFVIVGSNFITKSFTKWMVSSQDEGRYYSGLSLFKNYIFYNERRMQYETFFSCLCWWGDWQNYL